jgi:outer membrane receptor protein involved in Fe transport
VAVIIGALAGVIPALARGAEAPENLRIAGVVRDQSGAPIAGAEVRLRGGSWAASTTTDDKGRFSFELTQAQAGATPSGTLSVTAQGFAAVERRWSAQQAGTGRLEVVLVPASVSQSITVTATRTKMRASETAADTMVLEPEDLAATAALTLDDALRQVPGFTLFRRSGSRVGNPTAQGVSLRGVGASGASRALVLEDGIPLDDPFGSWVHWDRVPRESVSAVELVRGAASDLYGTEALGGVVNIVPRRPTDSSLFFESSYGNEQTPDASMAASVRSGRWVAGLDGEAFHTDGYVLVDPSERGRVDTRAGSDYRTADLELERLISERTRAFMRASVFEEARQNGKPEERNRTHLRQLAAGGNWQSDAAGAFSFRVYGGPELFDQNFFAVALDRNSETLTDVQRVPSQQLGATAQWSSPAGLRHTLVAGVDGREVRGSSDELLYSRMAVATGEVTIPPLRSAVGAGGRQHTFGFFGEDIIRLTPRWIITAGARFDHWRNFDALSATRPLATPGPTAVTVFPERTEQAFSPRLSILHKLTENVSLTASAYRAFRAPALNELYRSFRLGNILTLANSDLRAERLTGGEGGARFAAFDDKLVVRGTFFWSVITRPIANVTLSTTPALITRERENLGRTRSRGFDLDATSRLNHYLELSGGYEFADATVLRFPANTLLEGLRIPQVPRHQLTFQARYSNPSAARRLARLTFGVQGRLVGAQFDDDQNQFRLNRFFTLDALVSHPVAHGLEAFLATENLTNQRYDVARTPVRTVGPPALVRAGIRLELRAR